MDFNAKLANFMQRTGTSEAELSRIMDTLGDIGSSIFNNDVDWNSVFLYDDTATVDDLQSFICNVSGRDDEDYKEGIQLLFDIIDEDGDGQLTNKELDPFTGGDQTITAFDMFNQMSIKDEVKVHNELRLLKSDEIAERVKNGQTSLEVVADVYGEDSDVYKAVAAKVSGTESGNEASSSGIGTDKINEFAKKIVAGKTELSDYKSELSDEDYAALEAAVKELQGSGAAPADGAETDDPDVPTLQEGNTGDNVNEPSGNKTSYDFTNIDDAKAFLDAFVDENRQNYNDVIDYLLGIGGITEEQAEQLKSTLCQASLTAEQQAQIDRLVAAGHTEEEAMEILGITTNSNTAALQEKQYKEINYEEYADQLYNAMKGLGTDESALKSILNDETITDEQFVQIIKAYEEKYGLDSGGKGFVTRIENETSGDLQTQLTAKLGQRLINAANNGDEDAINLVCKEIYSGTAGQNCTANDYLSAIFNNADEETLYKIYESYSTVNNGRDLITDIKNDYSGILGWRTWGWNVNASGDGQSFIDKINEAIRHHKV